MSTEAAPTAPAPQAAATPSAPAAAPAAPQADPTLDSRLASLSKREREIQQQMAQLKQERQNMVPKNELSNLWKSDRNKLRELLGASPDELPDMKAPEADDPIKSIKQELEDMKRQKQEEDQHKAINELKSQINGIVSQDKDAYELIHAFDAKDMVFDLVLDHYREHQEQLDYAEAAKQVEAYLEDQIKKASSTKKISSLFQPSQPQGKEPAPTLTGSMVSSPVSGTQRRLSPEESLAEAAKLIKWT
jgi:hypothetical protein